MFLDRRRCSFLLVSIRVSEELFILLKFEMEDRKKGDLVGRKF